MTILDGVAEFSSPDGSSGGFTSITTKLAEGRTCGECTACCRLPWVDTVPGDKLQFAKPAGRSCVHLAADGRGCAEYHRRPGACRKFRCLWLEGFGEDGDRPDRSGVLAFVIGGPLLVLQLDRTHPSINFEVGRRLVRLLIPFMRYRLEAPALESEPTSVTANVTPELQHPAGVIPQCIRFLAEVARRAW